MRVNGLDYKTVWVMGSTVKLIDQTKLPFEFKIHDCPSYLDTCEAVKTMKVRGAGAIGAAAGFILAIFVLMKLFLKVSYFIILKSFFGACNFFSNSLNSPSVNCLLI